MFKQSYTVEEGSGNKTTLKSFKSLVNHIWISDYRWPETNAIPTLRELSDAASYPLRLALKGRSEKGTATVYLGIADETADETKEETAE